MIIFGVLLLIGLQIALLVLNLKRQNDGDYLNKKIENLEQRILQEFSILRQENGASMQGTRTEITNLFSVLSQQIQKQLTDNQVSAQILQKELTEQVKYLNEIIRHRMDDLSSQSEQFRKQVEEKLGSMRDKLEQKVSQLQESNEKKLEEMRKTVNEKLEETLNARFNESFKHVSDRLELVHKGLGEMQNLAQDVGGLKRVLSNVKTRGVLGEIHLGNILEEMLTTSQYEKNVKTKPGSNDLVEFAIRLPGKDLDGNSIYLPIDAKFPMEDYIRLMDAYEIADHTAIENERKNLIRVIKNCAKDISSKYLAPPYTTDFAIMFLPTEGLFAEVVRNSTLLETLHKEFKVIISGPTTLTAILNSLQMGFRTLNIEKRSSEIEKILASVRKEFENFGGILIKAQEKILRAGEDIDKLVGVRTKKIQQQLRKIEVSSSEQLIELDCLTDAELDEE